MVLENLSGLLAVLTTIFGTAMSAGFFLQIWKIRRRRSVADISVGMYLIFLPGSALWLLYGISINSLPLMVANVVGLIGIGGVLAGYLRYRGQPHHDAAWGMVRPGSDYQSG